MTQEITPYKRKKLARAGFTSLPAVIDDAGERARRRFVEFFVANIRNPNTRIAYARAVARFFNWCEEHHIALNKVEPILVAAYIEQHPGSAPTVKQHLAAIRMLFDYLVIGQVLPFNPAAASEVPSTWSNAARRQKILRPAP